MIQTRRRWALLAAAVVCCAGAVPTAERQKTIARIDLSKPFHLTSGAVFTATQGPDVDDPIYDGQTAPGLIHLCVRAGASASCAPNVDDALRGAEPIRFAQIHFLEISEIVYPHGRNRAPLFHLQVGSLHAGNGTQNHAALLLSYRPQERSFETVFQDQFGGNMNQETRYIASGPLKGAMIAVHPTDNAPFGYWVSVHRPAADYRYRQVLRYRSATVYNDGNPLAVIDSEMPNILRHLGMWRPGRPIPAPKRCRNPHLVKTELWCS